MSAGVEMLRALLREWVNLDERLGADGASAAECDDLCARTLAVLAECPDCVDDQPCSAHESTP